MKGPHGRHDEGWGEGAPASPDEPDVYFTLAGLTDPDPGVREQAARLRKSEAEKSPEGRETT